MGLIDSLRYLFKPQYTLELNVPTNNIRIMDFDSAELYKTQPNLQAVVTFLADNIAQLPIKAYERVSDTDRQRTTNSVAARLLKNPNTYMTQFELVRATALDYYIYGRCIWLLTEDDETDSGYSITPIPLVWVQQYHQRNSFMLDSIDVVAGSTALNIPADKLIIFSTYDPTNPCGSISPINAIKQTLTEQIEADKYRLAVWRNGGKASSYIVRPKDVQPWSPERAAEFKRDFKAAWTGNGSNVGGVPILEDGMEIKTLQFNAKESQWAEAKKMSREDVASIYHVNPALIWHTDGQTYASARDNARALYADTLAPMLQMLQQRINAFLLPKIGEQKNVYVEFDLKEKLRGSFEEQAQVIQSSVGAPWLTRNEARAMNNMPAVQGGDELIVPLNVLVGGQASPTDSGTQNLNAGEAQTKDASTHIKMRGTPEQRNADKLSEIFKAFYERQARSVLPKISSGKNNWFDLERWNTELSDDLFDEAIKQVTFSGKQYAEQLGFSFNALIINNYVRKMCDRRANATNELTQKRLISAIEEREAGNEEAEPKNVFVEQENRASSLGIAFATACATFAIREAVSQSNKPQSEVTKTWIVTSGNPRASHASMDGETVPFNEAFSNGAMFPHDSSLDAEESCYCQCIVEIDVP